MKVEIQVVVQEGQEDRLEDQTAHWVQMDLRDFPALPSLMLVFCLGFSSDLLPILLSAFSWFFFIISACSSASMASML